MRDGKFVFAVLGIIAVVVTGYVVFWGTIGAVVYHFVHKLW